MEQWLADPDFPEGQQDAYRQALEQRGVAARRRPWFQGDPRYADWVLPNHPVIGVSWFEAMAFCGWLTTFWREQGLLGADELIRLPTEIEWERAARGAEGRRWPWGDAWREGAANTEEAGLQSTTAVGLFPWSTPDADPEGATDMAGNVWEWTLTRWGARLREPDFGYPVQKDARDAVEGADLRIVRGGSWYNASRLCRGAYRYRGNPDDWDDSLGFRVVRVSLA